MALLPLDKLNRKEAAVLDKLFKTRYMTDSKRRASHIELDVLRKLKKFYYVLMVPATDITHPHFAEILWAISERGKMYVRAHAKRKINYA